jgi:hypothetical protein
MLSHRMWYRTQVMEVFRYLRFRAAFENQPFTLTIEFLERRALRSGMRPMNNRSRVARGVRTIFHVDIIENGRIIRDRHNPEAFALWAAKRAAV